VSFSPFEPFFSIPVRMLYVPIKGVAEGSYDAVLIGTLITFLSFQCIN
jgi:hypothetical protein